MIFPGLEMTILKFHDFSRFSMTVRTLYVSSKIRPSLRSNWKPWRQRNAASSSAVQTGTWLSPKQSVCQHLQLRVTRMLPSAHYQSWRGTSDRPPRPCVAAGHLHLCRPVVWDVFMWTPEKKEELLLDEVDSTKEVRHGMPLNMFVPERMAWRRLSLHLPETQTPLLQLRSWETEARPWPLSLLEPVTVWRLTSLLSGLSLKASASISMNSKPRSEWQKRETRNALVEVACRQRRRWEKKDLTQRLLDFPNIQDGAESEQTHLLFKQNPLPEVYLRMSMCVTSRPPCDFFCMCLVPNPLCYMCAHTSVGQLQVKWTKQKAVSPNPTSSERVTVWNRAFVFSPRGPTLISKGMSEEAL